MPATLCELLAIWCVLLRLAWAKVEQQNIFAEKRGEEQRLPRKRGAGPAEWPSLACGLPVIDVEILHCRPGIRPCVQDDTLRESTKAGGKEPAESVAPLGLESRAPYLRSQGSRPWAIFCRPFSGLDGCHPARSPDALPPCAEVEQQNIFAEKRGEEQRPPGERSASTAEWPSLACGLPVIDVEILHSRPGIRPSVQDDTLRESTKAGGEEPATMKRGGWCCG
jgi:hypothetical protein